MVELTENVIDTNAVLAAVADHRAGAVVLFLGTTRQFTGDRETESLDYECYPEMAKKEMVKLEDQVSSKWPLCKVHIVHRLGHLELGEASVAVAVSSPHRGDAFEAGKWLIDTLKEVVPIWKKENWVNGDTEWVHPTEDKS